MKFLTSLNEGFTPDEKIKGRLMNSLQGASRKDIQKFVDSIKNYDDEEKAFSLFTGWSSERERKDMYDNILYRLDVADFDVAQLESVSEKHSFSVINAMSDDELIDLYKMQANPDVDRLTVATTKRIIAELYKRGKTTKDGIFLESVTEDTVTDIKKLKKDEKYMISGVKDWTYLGIYKDAHVFKNLDTDGLSEFYEDELMKEIKSKQIHTQE
jgi:hypothetical protein